MKISPVLFFLSLLLLASTLRAEEKSAFPVVGFAVPPDQAYGWSLLPRGRPFMSLPSDPYDIGSALRKNSKQEIEAEVGTYRSFAGWKGKLSGGEDVFMHFGIEGKGLFYMYQQGSRFPLLSTDGFVGGYMEARKGFDFYQLRYTHISAHLSDGIYTSRNSIYFSREYIQLRYARQYGWIRPYVGYSYLTHTIPVLPRSAGEIGFYSVAPAHWGPVHPFFGADLRLRSAQEGTTYNLTTGTAIISSEGAPPLRISANYLNGNDIRGQFYNEKIRKFSMGLELDI